MAGISTWNWSERIYLSPYYTKYGLSQRYARDRRLNIWGDPELTQKYPEVKV